MTDQEQLCLVFIPALVAILKRAEREKGGLLTEHEVMKIRDSSTCMAVKVVDAAKLDERRGYADIVPEDAWNEWRSVRKQLGD